VRFPGLRSVTRSSTLRAPVCATLTLTEIATGLAAAALAEHRAEREVTLLAVSVSNIVAPALQLALPLDRSSALDGHDLAAGADAARWGVDRSVDAVRARFGHGAVGYATVVFSDAARVPDEFRELAEHGPS
jgi:DNA polymerase-4